jgi:hypothetical protein
VQRNFWFHFNFVTLSEYHVTGKAYQLIHLGQMLAALVEQRLEQSAVCDSLGPDVRQALDLSF